ncbi:MAG: DNA double-strand break repair nuclease NurA [Candidatus Hodarchaeales archaeon]
MSDRDKLDKQIKIILNHLKNTGSERCLLAGFLKKLTSDDMQNLPRYLRESLKEDVLFREVESISLDGLTLAGVDGGIVTTSLVSMDLIMLRSIAVIFHYGSKKIKKIDYLPSKHPVVEFFPSNKPYGYAEFETFSGFQRVISELEVACKVVKSYKLHVDVLLLDGALNLARTRQGMEKYSAKIELLVKELFENARRRGSLIAWCIKDSRTNYFIDFMGELIPKVARYIPEILNIDYRNTLNSTRDQHFMAVFLPVNARSFLLKREAGVGMIMKQLGMIMYSFYLKSAAYDFPFRIDFAVPDDLPEKLIIDTANRIASVTLSVSRIHDGYSVPVPIIEADARARISQREFQTIITSIRKRINTADTLSLKRERSPFIF